MKNFRLIGLAALAFAGLLPLTAQTNSGISKQQADDILNELRQIRQLIERQGRPQAQAAPAEQVVKAKLSLDGVPMLGNKDAPITIVEFTDYQCPFCQRFHVTTYPELKKNYIDTGKVRFYSRDLPLTDMHPNAMRAAQAARCAGEQNHYWTLREVMSANPAKLSMDHIMVYASDLKMDVNKFRNCLSDEKYKAAVQSDVMEAMRIGANGTPAFVVGKSTPEGVDGELMLGAMPIGMFEEKFKALAK